MKKIGVLLVNLGTPNSPFFLDVFRYLNEFLMDGRVIDYPWFLRFFLVRCFIVPFRTRSSSKLYQMLWQETGSPLLTYGKSLKEHLEKTLGSSFFVELAMRYQSPSIEEGLQKLEEKGISEVLIFPLFPQYASATTGSIMEKVFSIVSKWKIIPPLRFIPYFYDNIHFLNAWEILGKKIAFSSYDHVLFSYHGLPEKHLKKTSPKANCLTLGCCEKKELENTFCYRFHCRETTKNLVKRFGLEKGFYSESFQSRLGKDPWTSPFTSDVLIELAKKGKKKLLVFSPSFIADCLETNIEIGFELRKEFEKHGGERLDLVPSLNDEFFWHEAVKKMIQEEVGFLQDLKSFSYNSEDTCKTAVP